MDTYYYNVSFYFFKDVIYKEVQNMPLKLVADNVNTRKNDKLFDEIFDITYEYKAIEKLLTGLNNITKEEKRHENCTRVYAIDLILNEMTITNNKLYKVLQRL